MIKTTNLRKSFNERQVVKDLTFEAPDGSITGLLGANGVGKTTTLRMICGVLQPDSGYASIDHVRAGSAEAQRNVGALLDHIGLYSRLTVRENLAYFGQLRGMQPEMIIERVESVISALGLETIANLRTAGFSQGERMKTALGRALLHSPKNVLLDEPTNALDIPTIRSLRELLRKLRDAGTCVVFSSHVLDEVSALCDRVAVMMDGRIVAVGSPQQLCSQTGTGSLEDAFIELTCPAEVCSL
jgi:sodium transport system ATP-binding protein